MAKQDQDTASPRKVEGEGSYTGSRRYNEGVKQHIANNDTEELAERAKRALQGEERQELEEAEQRAKRGPSPKP